MTKRDVKAPWRKFFSGHADYGMQLVTGLQGSSKAFFAYQWVQTQQQPLIIVTPHLLQATQWVQDLQFLLPEDQLYLFPTEESIAAEFAFASLDLMAQRVEALAFLASGKPGVVVVPLSGLQRRIAPPEVFMAGILHFSVGQAYDVTALADQFVTMGYVREMMVDRPGTFSIRGGIVDIYPLTLDNPVRLDFFDDELDSIRSFDEETQKSIAPIDAVTIMPSTDALVDRETRIARAAHIRKVSAKQIAAVADAETKDALTAHFDHVLSLWETGEAGEDDTRYLSLFYADGWTLADYLADRGAVLFDDWARINEARKHDEQLALEWQLTQVAEGQLLPQQALLVPLNETVKRLPQRSIYLSTLQKGLGRLRFDAVTELPSRVVPQFFSQMPTVKMEVLRWLKQGMFVVMLVSQEAKAEKLVDTLHDYGMPASLVAPDACEQGQVSVVVGNVNHGFELPEEQLVLLTERELFNTVYKPIARRQNMSNAERLKSYNELAVGDFIVHVNHGIGQYRGIETMTIGDVKQDYLSIVYDGDTQLYVPVTQIQLVQKYVASDGREPRLNKLGGTEWAKTKRKVASKIEDIADELVALYAKRESEVGYAFAKDTPDQQAFEDAFIYTETPDQLRSSEEIKRDMEKARPMDRLLVGDVGYGKTEVAMRAIFKAIQEGKQVALLVPTTILAQQHYHTITQRFSDYPVKVGLLSRFRTKQEQQQTALELANGQVDIVIGTHRLLSQDIQFSDLGLIIIDEEQRFGVRHKERLKQLKTQVDVLTLTATPIPRTLHMSMLGVRDLSVIETPPANRYPVQTYVMEQRYDVIRDAMMREMSRGGQVFYLFNNIERIEQRASQLRDLVPEARVGVAHGWMTEIQLENTLMEFMEGMYDVLVTTTIIETGVDMPNVNTLIVENADRMGLSQLYQLRGRVGRTNRMAYAYFMFQADKVLTETSEKRLEAIKEFSQLGAGFKIAMRDLSIRGAGNLLGREQHGFIDSVGFDMYSEMLKEAVAKRRGDKPQRTTHAVEIDLGISAYIPSDYVADERQKIALYKRIRTIENVTEYREIQDDLIDRFGDYPDEVAHLVQIGLIKCYAEQQRVIKITRKSTAIDVVFDASQQDQMNVKLLFEQLSYTNLRAAIQPEGNHIRVSLNVAGIRVDNWLDQLVQFLGSHHTLRTEEGVHV